MAQIHRRIESCFERFTDLVYQWKWASLAIMVLMTAGLAVQVPDIRIDTRDESFFHEDDPELVAYNDFRDRFGQDDLFIIALKPASGMTPDFFATLSALFYDLKENIPYLDDIDALVNGRVVRAEGDTLLVEDLMAEPPATHEAVQQMMSLVNRYPMYENLLVSRDRTLASILVRAQAIIDTAEDEVLAAFDDPVQSSIPHQKNYLSNAQNMEIAAAVYAVTERYQDRGIEFHYSGTPVFVAEIQKAIEKDLGLMVPLSFLIIILFLILLFRRTSGVIYPLMTVFFSLISCLGIMALADIAITNVIQILPTFLIVVGIADSVHILTLFYRNLNKGMDKKQAIVRAAGSAGLPVLMTSMTTALGLISFVWADIAAIAQLGYVAPVGVMLAFFYTIIMLPALIAVFPVKQKSVAHEKTLPFMDRLFNQLAAVSTRRPIMVSSVAAVILITAGYHALSVRISHNAMEWFPEQAPIRTATQMLNHVNGGTVMLEVLVDTGRENGLQDPDILKRMDEAVSYIPTIREQGIAAAKAWSITDLLKETHRALNADDDSAYALPGSRELIAQELLLFELSGSEDLTEVTDSNYRTGRLSILAPWADSVIYKDYVRKVVDYLDRQFPTETATLTGHMALFVKITKNFITSLVKSYTFAILVITLLMVILIGRLRIGLMSMVANLGPIICVFGIMGAVAIPLDMATILIGSIVLGLVVDDTIHFLHHFRAAFDDTGCVETAVRETLHTTGRALLITSMVLCGGFFVYTTSYLVSNIRFGLLTGSAVIFALVADFLLIPALLSLAYGRRRQVVAAT
ncbi:MAG: MMPL family transporter [Desulfobacteraceae bacterium]|nr:MMPL family transporter [Desulfobacteraceae bacterium]